MINVFILDTTLLTENNTFSECYNKLSMKTGKISKKSKSQNFKLLNPESEILFNYGLREYNIDANKIEINYNKFGKPFIKNNDSLKFNISHSGKYVVCAFSEFEIGIDIQEIVPIKLSSIKHFLPKSCITRILKQDSKIKQTLEFYRIWTIYESYTKLLGNGLTYPFPEIDLESIVNNHLLNVDDEIYNFYELDLQNEKYLISICSTDTNINKIVYLKPR